MALVQRVRMLCWVRPWSGELCFSVTVTTTSSITITTTSRASVTCAATGVGSSRRRNEQRRYEPQRKFQILEAPPGDVATTTRAELLRFRTRGTYLLLPVLGTRVFLLPQSSELTPKRFGVRGGGLATEVDTHVGAAAIVDERAIGQQRNRDRCLAAGRTRWTVSDHAEGEGTGSDHVQKGTRQWVPNVSDNRDFSEGLCQLEHSQECFGGRGGRSAQNL